MIMAIDLTNPATQDVLFRDVYLPGFAAGFSKQAAAHGLPPVSNDQELLALVEIKVASDAQRAKEGIDRPYTKLASMLVPQSPARAQYAGAEDVALSPSLVDLFRNPKV
jgi:hypothetical protein